MSEEMGPTYSLAETVERLGAGGRTVLHLRSEGTLVGVVGEDGSPRFTKASVDAAAERGIGRGSKEFMVAPATFEVKTR